MWSPQDFNKILLVINLYWYARLSAAPDNVCADKMRRSQIAGLINLISIFQSHQISKIGASISLLPLMMPEFKCR